VLTYLLIILVDLFYYLLIKDIKYKVILLLL